MNVSLKFVITPWWMRFVHAFELLMFGSVLIEGKVTDVHEYDTEAVYQTRSEH